MGRLILPFNSDIYVDANIVLYTVDWHPVYAPLCAPLWQASQQGSVTVFSSELTLLETLVVPFRTQDQYQREVRESLWKRSNNSLLPITKDVLREAAHLRATISGLKTPDAIHAATALINQCNLFITNDR
ncbi:MAG: PIN domain-containing protein, partial [Chthonomonadaceae bacterium]|nr:PIN domain-containing protein [Chthonomonadaceae bacterium]